MISVDNVTKVYRSGSTEVAALRGVSLRVDGGAFLAIAGPSGSGKTTLLNLIGCLDTATSGDVVIGGQRVSALNRKQLALFRRDHLGFIFQSFNLIPVLTAFENVSFALSLLTRDAKQVRDRTMAILDDVGLADMADRRPGELSGGQQQRVAIARALVKDPDIVLADEPTANVDSEIGEGLLELMRSLNRRHSTTFLFSTHDAMVMDYADRLVRLQDGRISADELRAADGGAPVADGGAPVADGGAPGADGSVPVADGSVPVADGSVPVADGSVPVADGSVPVADGGAPLSAGGDR